MKVKQLDTIRRKRSVIDMCNELHKWSEEIQVQARRLLFSTQSGGWWRPKGVRTCLRGASKRSWCNFRYAWPAATRLPRMIQRRTEAAEQAVPQRLPKLQSAIAADPPHDGSLITGEGHRSRTVSQRLRRFQPFPLHKPFAFLCLFRGHRSSFIRIPHWRSR